MPSKSQSGFAPILIVILLAVIAGSSIVVIKNIPFNEPKPTSVVQQQSTSSAQIKTSPSPTVSKALTPTTSKKAAPTPTKTPTGTTSSNNSGSSSNNSNTSSPTNTPAPTNNPTPTSFAPSPTATPQPPAAYVKVTFPNGGESFAVGDNLTVAWDTTMVLGSCQIQTIDSNNSGSVIGTSVNVTNRSIVWTATIGNTTLTERQLKIYMICRDFNGGTQFAQSDNYFIVHK